MDGVVFHISIPCMKIDQRKRRYRSRDFSWNAQSRFSTPNVWRALMIRLSTHILAFSIMHLPTKSFSPL